MIARRGVVVASDCKSDDCTFDTHMGNEFFSFRSGNKTKRSINFCHSIHNFSKIGRKERLSVYQWVPHPIL